MIRKHHELTLRNTATNELRTVTVKVQISENVPGLHVALVTAGDERVELQRELECPQTLEPSPN